MIVMTRQQLSALHAAIEDAIAAVRIAPIPEGERLASAATLRLIQQAASMYRVRGPVERELAGLRFAFDGADRATLSVAEGDPRDEDTARMLLAAARALIARHVVDREGMPAIEEQAAARTADAADDAREYGAQPAATIAAAQAEVARVIRERRAAARRVVLDVLK